MASPARPTPASISGCASHGSRRWPGDAPLPVRESTEPQTRIHEFQGGRATCGLPCIALNSGLSRWTARDVLIAISRGAARPGGSAAPLLPEPQAAASSDFH
jgi:hypothetical protein